MNSKVERVAGAGESSLGSGGNPAALGTRDPGTSHEYRAEVFYGERLLGPMPMSGWAILSQEAATLEAWHRARQRDRLLHYAERERWTMSAIGDEACGGHLYLLLKEAAVRLAETGGCCE